MKRSFQSAFTLVELSIVLVILGLLVGGVLTGQSLIRAAELRSVTVEYNGYVTALGAFKDKYMALPGDMPNATDYWGAATCDSTTANVGTATCNGDGDGSLENQPEWWNFWQQLANAQLIEGNFSGIPGTQGGEQAIIGVNAPRSKFPHAGWTAIQSESYSDINGIGRPFPSTQGQNLFSFGSATDEQITVGGILKPEEAYNIDVKIDDGKPNIGKVTSLHDRAPCEISPYDTYNLSEASKACALFFSMGY